jgi:hypothetical protein
MENISSSKATCYCADLIISDCLRVVNAMGQCRTDFRENGQKRWAPKKIVAGFAWVRCRLEIFPPSSVKRGKRVLI